jgi:drug/metabolite transporter (DMT)-like permease
MTSRVDPREAAMMITSITNGYRTSICAAIAAAVFAPALWAGNFVVGRAVHDAIPPLTLNCLRWLVALAVLLPMFGRPAWAARAELTRKWRSIGLLALSGVVGFNSMLYVGLQHTTALSAAMISSITPLLIIGLSAWIGGTRISILQALAGLVSVTGALIVLGGDIGSLGAGGMIGGNLIVLLSCFVWAAYCVSIKTCRINADSGSILLASTICGLMVQIPLGIGEIAIGGLPHIDIPALIAVAYLGLGAATLGFLVWYFAIGRLGPARCGIFLNLTPVFGIFMSMGLLQEQVLFHHIAGGLCVAIGVALAQIKGGAVSRPSVQSLDPAQTTASAFAAPGRSAE